MYPYVELHDINSCWFPLAEKNLLVWRKGHVLEGSKDVYLLIKGRIRLKVTSPDGMEKILWDLCDNTVFNETPVLAPLSGVHYRRPGYSFTHVCVCDCLVGRILLEDVLEQGRRDPELLVNLCGSFALKLSLLAHKAASEHLDTPRMRVFRFLAARIIPGTVPPSIRKDLSMQDIASLIGLHRVSLYKELNWARKQKILSFERNDSVIRILDMERFCREAGILDQRGKTERQKAQGADSLS